MDTAEKIMPNNLQRSLIWLVGLNPKLLIYYWIIINTYRKKKQLHSTQSTRTSIAATIIFFQMCYTIKLK